MRRVEAAPGDPLYERIEEVQRSLRAVGPTGLFTSWIPHRRYTPAELEAAEVLRLDIHAVFEPAGEDCGTVYDESTACAQCGVGRTQVSELTLNLRGISAGWDVHTRPGPQAKDIARTIADEIVVSDRLATLFREHQVSGVELRRVRHYRTPRTPLPAWYQPVVTSAPVRAVAPTSFGINPFDEDAAGLYRCPLGHVAGLNLLSELTIRGSDWDGADIVATAEAVGHRGGGLLVPSPLLLVSPRLYRLFHDERVKGARVEVAHLG